MARARGGIRGAQQASASKGTRRSTRRSAAENAPTSQEDCPPDVFSGLLEEMEDREEVALNERPIKRRKVTEALVTDQPQTIEFDSAVPNARCDNENSAHEMLSEDEKFENVLDRPLQTVYDDSDDSEESEPDWEEVDLLNGDSHASTTAAKPQAADMVISLEKATDHPTTPKKQRRPGITAAERKRRLEIHKLHLLCLLYHCHLRNAWCNDSALQAALKPLLTPKLINQLLPSPDVSQFQAARSFVDGLNGVKALWRDRFRVNRHGMRQPQWVEEESQLGKLFKLDNIDPPITREDFRKYATSLNGSQDAGAQVFCALLRSIGVEARLVCSLQCLPYNASAPISQPPSASSSKHTVYLHPSTNIIMQNKPEQKQKPSPTAKITPGRVKRIGATGRISTSSVTMDKGRAPKMTAIPRIRPTIKPQYPVFWVEAFNAAHQKWISVDPLATFTVDKPLKIEPPLNSANNSMVYVMAFEEDGIVRDITRRYAKAYNAKTMKSRVESTPHGQQWLSKALKPFRRGRQLNRDQVEDAALTRQEASEGLPRNIQDFRHHPIYVLERYLRHNEVIHPQTEVGKVTAGAHSSEKAESVYRRRDVHTVRSGDKWYRLGREVKAGEQPLKYAKPRKSRATSTMSQNNAEVNATGVALYAGFQTDLYVPPPVVRGRIPKNAFGNLDVYVPSMVPAGACHIRHPNASKAARLAGVDFADAVTGFTFKGRVGTAVVQGCVVAIHYQEAIEAIINGMDFAADEAAMSSRINKALRMWKRFVTGLRIVERVKEYASDEENDGAENLEHDSEVRSAIKDALEAREADEDRDAVYEGADNDQGGGFFPGETADEIAALPTAHTFRTRGQDTMASQFPTYDADDHGGGFVPDTNASGSDPKFASTAIPDVEHPQYGEPFDDQSDGGGGFLIEDEQPGLTATTPMSATRSSPTRPKPGDDITMSGALVSSASHDDSLQHDDVPMSNADTHLRETPDEKITLDTYESMANVPIDARRTMSVSSNPTKLNSGTLKPATLKREPSNLSDQASLLSHDPEDEDADPEWLL